ncbi:hypothetical protein IW140_005438 [Coemansia sp. RSA 1813]|nr:hypothetical protein IW140_005438 [Coemansia sp. RSA 1813]
MVNDGSSSESESDAETKRLLQVRLRARQLAKDDDSSDSEDGSDQHSASAKVRSESQARKHDTVQIPIQDIQEALTNRALHPHKELSQTSEVSLESESESTDTDSSESTEGYAPQVLLKPMFVPKSQRLSKSQGNDIVPGNANNTEGIGDDEIDRKRQERRDESIRMAAEEAARSRQQPDIDDADELNVDDTDDMDVEAEFGAWRLREISRIERDKTEKEEADAEEEEREQAQNMTEEEKNRVGLERARKQRKDKAQERAEKAVSFTKKEQTDSNVSMNDRMTQDMLEYALNTNNGRKGNSKWRGYGKEDTSSDQSLWNKGVRQSRKR